MNLLSLQDVSKQYAHKFILNQISLHILRHEKIAIVGKNGSGKTSLLNIIAGELEIDSGERMVQSQLKILSLEQKPVFEAHASVQDVLVASMRELQSAHDRLQMLTQQIDEHPGKEALEEYARLSAYLDEYNGWDLQARAQEILQYFGLDGFKDRLANSLSGGEQKRVALASLLLQKCDILLLDEPTNHLDVEMVGFLEKFISKSKITLVFISHDRYFIDNVATRILEIDEGKLLSFDGGYMDYLRKKEEILKNLNQQHEKLLKLLKSEEEWLRRGVKARVKRNEGRKNRILQMRQEAKSNPALIRKMRLELERERKSFNQAEGRNNQKCLFEIEHLHKSLGEKILISDLNLRILQNEKIAIVGKNGSGKTSFLKMLLGEISVDSGSIKSGEITIGYFDQHTAMLDDEKDLLETFCPNAGEYVRVRGKDIHVFGYLKNFFFPKEFLTQKIGALSGGEKNRVALALLFTKDVDVLILDEPTNDLDIQTINVIEEYLMSMSCSVIFVSHDRYFVDKLAHKLLIFEGQGVVREGHILYSEYLAISESLHEVENLERELVQSEVVEAPKNVKRAQKLSYNEKRMFEELPEQIAGLEEEQKRLHKALSDPRQYEQNGIGVLAQELKQVEQILQEKLEMYFALEQKSQDIAQG